MMSFDIFLFFTNANVAIFAFALVNVRVAILAFSLDNARVAFLVHTWVL